MTSAVATAPAPAPAQPKKAPVAMNRFVRGSTEHLEPFYDSGLIAMTANPQQFGPIDVLPFGWARNILIEITATGGSGSTTVAAKADAPWSALQNIQFMDVNGTPVNYSLGYDLYLENKWGFYQYATDPALSPIFSNVATGASASGNFTILLRIPLEIRKDGLGSLPNGSASSTFKVLGNLAGSSDIYSTAPTNLPSYRVRMSLEAWQKPAPADVHGVPNAPAPPANGTTQYWSRQVPVVATGDQTITLKRVGNLIRNLIFVYRDNSGNRLAAANWPDPLRVTLDSQLIYNVGRDLLQNWMWERSGQNPDTGVFVLDFVHDGGKGAEQSDLYLPTSQASNLQIEGIFGSAGTVTILTNDIKPTANLVPQDGAAMASA